MKPIVFVDIDGVLNSPRDYHEWNAAWRETRPDGDPWHDPTEDPHVLKLFNKDLVAKLNSITDPVDADVVVSSSWRLFYASRFDKLRDILKAAGVHANVLEATPVGFPERWEAILIWLHTRGKGQRVQYVILDDEAPRFRMTHINAHLVQTSSVVGLQDHDVRRALKILKRKELIP
jgi:hypothetical protein